MADAVKTSKITIKQSKFLKEYLKHGNGTKAALAVYDTKDYNSAAQIAHENLKKLENPMALLMESMGITPKSLIETVDEARQAIKVNEFTGEQLPDHNTRLKAVSQMSKWARLDPEKETTQSQTNVQVNMGVSFTDD
jgi:phage terminase small subunit